MKTLCIYHANCADGLGAAWAVHRALGPDVEFVAAKYGDDPPDCTRVSLGIPDGSMGELGKDYMLACNALAGRDILIVDFSYPLPVLRAMAQEARSVLVLDHHATAEKELAELPGASTDTYESFLKYGETGGANLAAIFDQSRSGAGIAWDYLHPGNAAAAEPSKRYGSRPRIIDLIEDRDLWKCKFGDVNRAFHAVLNRAFHAVLASYDWSDLPTMFRRLDEWDRRTRNHAYIAEDVKTSRELGRETQWEILLAEGYAILRAQGRDVRAAVASSRRTICIAGHTVPCANVPPSMASDAGHLLCQPMPVSFSTDGTLLDILTETPYFSATYYDGADGKRHFSLRSPEGGADVGQIAKAMAEKFNADPETQAIFQGIQFAGGGHAHAAGFDAPLGWEGEP